MLGVALGVGVVENEGPEFSGASLVVTATLGLAADALS